MIQFNPAGNILNDIPNNGTIRLSAIVKCRLITKFPNSVQNRLNEENNNRTVPRNTRRKTKKLNRNAIRNKRPRGGQKRRKQRNKEGPNELHSRTIQKTMINRLPARAGCTFVRRDITPVVQGVANFNGFQGD